MRRLQRNVSATGDALQACCAAITCLPLQTCMHQSLAAATRDGLISGRLLSQLSDQVPAHPELALHDDGHIGELLLPG